MFFLDRLNFFQNYHKRPTTISSNYSTNNKKLEPNRFRVRNRPNLVQPEKENITNTNNKDEYYRFRDSKRTKFS